MPQLFSNAARAKLAAILASGATSMTLDSGALFPVANAGTSAVSDSNDWFKAVIQDQTNFEIVYVRSHTSGSDSFTNVLRAQEGTSSPASFAVDAVVGLRPLASDANAAANLRTKQTGPTGSSLVPAGTAAQRDASPVAGMFRANTDSGEFEGYIGGAWKTIGASAVIQSVVEAVATAGQTTFSASYTAGQVAVFLNGRRLGSLDYTATNGTQVVLSSGAALGDILAVVTYKAGSIANALAKTGDTATGPISVPSGATGAQVPQAQEVYAAVAAKADSVRPTLTAPREVAVVMAANNIDCNIASCFTKSISGNTAFTVSNIPAAGIRCSFELELTVISGVPTFWSGCKWDSGSQPAIAVGATAIFYFRTIDGGVTWRAYVAAKDSK